MNDGKELLKILEHELRWYYRLPIILALSGVALVVIFTVLIYLVPEQGAFAVVRLIGGTLFFVGLGAQCVLGFDYIGWRWKK